MSKYELKIDLNILNHLGLNLYSNVVAVLSELIANTWDADSTKVRIDISQGKIIIEDNGCGMDSSDLNEKFLKVGHQRRLNDGDLTPIRARKVMGRKGIGKLSIFSISEHIKVYTKKGGLLIGIEMDVSEIRDAIKNKQTYYPKEITSIKTDVIKDTTGTKIVLEKIKKRVQSSIDSNLKKRVARRFDIWSDTFKVFINDSRVSIKDRDYFHKLEFVTTYGNHHDDYFKSIPTENVHSRDNAIEEGESISGWIGLVKESGGLQDGADNLNKISVLARGKVALEDILDLYREGGLYTKFLIGEIRADFLDSTVKEDIATSSRQDFIQNDKRFIRLKEFIKDELQYIQQERAKYKERHGINKAEEIPEIKAWFSNLKGDAKKSAKKLFGKINTIATDNKHQKTLYKHGILAFEGMHHKEKLEQLNSISIDNIETTLEVFSELDDIEASWYYQITKGRLEIIRKLQDHIQKNALEKVIQKYIYDHLWLLDPSWERATESPVMEKSIITAFDKVSDKLSDEERKGRMDIKYRKTSGKHIIIELKRSSVVPKMGELMDQVKKYKTALVKQLQHHKETTEVEIVCLVGNGLLGWDNSTEKQNDERSLSAQDITVITYQQLIKDAENSYKSYLDMRKDKGRIELLLQSIDAL